MSASIVSTQQLIALAATPLPGCEPYANERPVAIPASHHRRPLLEVLSDRFPQIPRAEWEARCAAGRFVHRTGRVLGKDDSLPAGDRVMQRFPDYIEPPVATDIRVLHEDESMLVLDKPAPLPMHPSGRYNRNTLQHLLLLAFGAGAPLPVHRLDANTAGVVVFARDRRSCALLQRQFLAGAVEKSYRVRVVGHPPEDRFSITAPIAKGPGALGTHAVDLNAGLPAHTGFRVLRRDADGTALLDARLGTGRTNQIRVHLWQAGWPVCGDPAYLPDGRIGTTQTLALEAPPMQLHARRLALHHPLDGRLLEFVSERRLELC